MTVLPTDVQVTMLLCDHASVAEGKLYVSGGGWTHISDSPSPFAIALLVNVPWSMADRDLPFTLRLLGADGHQAVVNDATGSRPLQVDGQISVGRPPGTLPGSMLPVPLAFNFPGLPLPPGERLVWRLEIDGRHHDDWALAFDVRDRAAT